MITAKEAREQSLRHAGKEADSWCDIIMQRIGRAVDSGYLELKIDNVNFRSLKSADNTKLRESLEAAGYVWTVSGNETTISWATATI